jgi:hypothetical protein
MDAARAEVKPPSKWRAEHREFQNAMRAAHGKPEPRGSEVASFTHPSTACSCLSRIAKEIYRVVHE